MKKKNTAFVALFTLSLATALGIQPSQRNNKNETENALRTDTDSIKDSKELKHKHGDKKDDKTSKETDYAKLIKEKGSVTDGVLRVRHIKDKWYFEIPDSLLGRYFLTVTRFTGVPQGFAKFSGEQANEETVYFEKRDSATMLLRAYSISQVADPKSKIYNTLVQSTINPIISSFPMIKGHPDKKTSMIDVTNLFLKDNATTGIDKTLTTVAKLGGLIADRSFIDTIKTYPINIEIATTRTYSMTDRKLIASSTGAVTLGLNTSIVLLPKTPMQRRIWDERVGYFVNRITYFTDDQHKVEKEAFISRYRLVPKDKKAYAQGKLVEPVKQIVYYIDPATPKKWVPYLIKGINDWNVAFEAAGFKNAIVGKEWPNDPTMSLDDARFSVLRYLPSETENAYGPRIVDPRSGEIIESHIGWYHNVMNLLTKWYMVQAGPLDKRAQRMKFDDKLMGELIRFVSSHEVGHTLGLRHNMGASHATPVEKLRDKAWVEKYGHTASIMDYARFNYVAQPEDNIGEKGVFPRVNDYDKWAIKWGYQYRPEFKDEESEKKALMKETTAILKNNPRLWFAGEGRDEDPRSQLEDLGDDNVKASDYGIKNLKRVIAGLPVWTHQDNEQYSDLKEMYTAVRRQYSRYVNHVVKNLGGRYLNNRPGLEPFEIAPAEKPKAAVDFVGRQLFDAPLWLYPSTITSKVGIDTQAELTAFQKNILDIMMGAKMLNTLYNDSFLSAKAYKLTDYLDDLFKIVWRPLPNEEGISVNLRRNLQRRYISNLNSLLNPAEKDKTTAPYNSDAMLYVEDNLAKVEAYIKAQEVSASGINKPFYSSLLRELKLIRERQTDIRR